MSAQLLGTEVSFVAMLEAETALHVGAADSDGDRDLPLLVDGDGVALLPGTSLAGVFFGWMRDVAADHGEPYVAAVGTLQGSHEASGDTGGASRLFIEDAPLLSGAGVELRDGVGIDRFTGAAAMGTKMADADRATGGFKFVREVLPAGTRFALSLQARLVGDTDEVAAQHRVIESLIGALARGEIAVGAATTRGLGQVRLVAVERHERDESSATDLLDRMRSGPVARLSPAAQGTSGPECAEAYGADNTLLRSRSWDVTAIWSPEDVVMVKSGSAGIAVQQIPLTTMIGSGQEARVHLVLPGSSIKGAMRAQAERIVRTVLGRDVSRVDDLGFLDQLADERLELVHLLFGSANQMGVSTSQTPGGELSDDGFSDGDDRAGSNPRGVTGAAGLVRVGDVHSVTSWSPNDWHRVRSCAVDENLRLNELRSILLGNDRAKPVSHLRVATHVAIDRWTGGAAENRLFQVLEPIGITWHPLRFRIAGVLDDDPLGAAAVFLLLLVLKDFAAGWVPLGYGTQRGMGTVEVSEIRFGETSPEPLTGATLSELTAEDLDQLTCAWRAWIDERSE